MKVYESTFILPSWLEVLSYHLLQYNLSSVRLKQIKSSPPFAHTVATITSNTHAPLRVLARADPTRFLLFSQDPTRQG